MKIHERYRPCPQCGREFFGDGEQCFACAEGLPQLPDPRETTPPQTAPDEDYGVYLPE